MLLLFTDSKDVISQKVVSLLDCEFKLIYKGYDINFCGFINFTGTKAEFDVSR